VNKEKFIKRDIETVFRCSNSSDELFDAFRAAIESKVKDEELYKILLWNKALSVDEIRMFAGKLCREYPELSFRIYYDVGKILEASSVYGSNLDLALQYYKKAAEANPGSFLPHTAAAAMYNKDLNLPKFEKVTEFLQQGMESVERKSKICFTLVNLYKKRGNREKEKKFQKLGEKYQREGK
jgi:tetratricopeptide (TPR) repeat protein